MSSNSGRNLFTENGLSLHKPELSQKVTSLGTELDGLSLCCHVSSKRFWTLHEPDVPLKLSLVTSLSCFSVPELRCVRCTRVFDSCAHIITFATRLWTETRAELVAVRGLLILSQSERTRSATRGSTPRRATSLTGE